MGRRTQRSRPEISACEDTPSSTDAPPPHPDFPAPSPGPRNQGCGQSAPGAGRLGTVPGRDSRRNESGREAGLCARRGAGRTHSRGPPGGLARVLSGRGVTSPARGSLLCRFPAVPVFSLVRLPALLSPLSPSAPKATPAPPRPSRPRHAAAKGRGRGGERGPPLPIPSPFRKVHIAPPASQGQRTWSWFS